MLRSTLSSLTIVVAAISFGAWIGMQVQPGDDQGNSSQLSKGDQINSGKISRSDRNNDYLERIKLIQRIKKASIEPDLTKSYRLPPKVENYELPPKDDAKRFYSEQTYPNESYTPRYSQPKIKEHIPLATGSVTQLVSFNNSPFPYTGRMPHGKPFMNFNKEGRDAHKTRSGRVYYAEETYSDDRVLLHVPRTFDINKPGVIILFFHGHGATLERDVMSRQRVPQQISGSGVNAVLVAPQFAVDARDSSAGKFWQYGGAYRFLKETAHKLAMMYGAAGAEPIFNKMPVVIVGYSGGYSPTAWSLAKGGITKRVKGVVLLDGLYGHLRTFANFIARNRQAFFLSAHTYLTRRRNVKLQEMLKKRGVSFETEVSGELGPGNVLFVESDEKHHHYVTQAWVQYPIADMLVRLNGGLPHMQRIRSASY